MESEGTSTHNSLVNKTSYQARGSAVQVAFSPSCKNNFPMIEWNLISPSPYFWKINVDLAFVDEKLSALNERAKKIIENGETDHQKTEEKIEKFVLITFQNRNAELATLAKKKEEGTSKEKEKETEEHEDTIDDEDKKQKRNDKANNNNKDSIYMYSEEITEWKDNCRENVVALAELIHERLVERASSNSSSLWWFDAADPATGCPLLESTAGPSIYCESDAIEQLMKMPVVAVGIGNSVCRLVQHPKHGMDVYPSSMFYVGPRRLLEEVLKDL